MERRDFMKVAGAALAVAAMPAYVGTKAIRRFSDPIEGSIADAGWECIVALDTLAVMVIHRHDGEYEWVNAEAPENWRHFICTESEINQLRSDWTRWKVRNGYIIESMKDASETPSRTSAEYLMAVRPQPGELIDVQDRNPRRSV